MPIAKFNELFVLLFDERPYGQTPLSFFGQLSKRIKI